MSSASAIACVTVRAGKSACARRFVMFLSFDPNATPRCEQPIAFCHFCGVTSSKAISLPASTPSMRPTPLPKVNALTTPICGDDDTFSSSAIVVLVFALL